VIPQAVEAMLRSWYEAIHIYDFEAIESALTPTFSILEDATPLDRVGLLDRLRKYRPRGPQVAELSELKTRVHGDVAWITLRNRETWTPTEGPAVKEESLDESVLTPIQALDRTQPLLPMQPGQVESRTHDYKRHGTTTLFAALNAKTSEVITQFHQRHRSRCHAASTCTSSWVTKAPTKRR